MSEDRHFERRAREWLELGPTDAPDRVFDAAFDEIAVTSQKRALRGPWRLVRMSRPLRLAATAIVAALAVIGTLSVIGQFDGGVGGATPPVDPAPTASPSPTAPESRTAILLIARDIAFDQRTLEVVPNTSFVIHLVNRDRSVPHSVDLRTADGRSWTRHAVVEGGGEKDFAFEGLPPGTYTFICSVHPIPSMTGTLIVR